MIDLHLFAEDVGHEIVVGELIRQISATSGSAVRVHPRSVRGGYGRTIAAVREYAREIDEKSQPMPDVLVVAADANCRGYAERLRAIREAVGHLSDRLVCAIPDPHVERWLLVDGHAFKAALGRGCAAPDQKCDRDRYKELLIQAVLDAGRPALLDGLEHAVGIVRAMDFPTARRTDPSLGRFLQDLESMLGRATL